MRVHAEVSTGLGPLTLATLFFALTVCELGLVIPPCTLCLMSFLHPVVCANLSVELAQSPPVCLSLPLVLLFSSLLEEVGAGACPR